MKKILFLLMFPMLCFGQIDVPIQNTSTDENVRYRLFATKNMYTFIKLDTRNGLMWQVQWSTKGADYRYETILNDLKLAETNENGRFFLYSTTNIYNSILLDQFDGRAWQVQWNSEKSDRLVMRIY